MTVAENIKHLIREAWPEGAPLAANGANLKQFMKNFDVEDDRLTWMLSFVGFVQFAGYELESGEVIKQSSDPDDQLMFRLLVRFPEADESTIDADGYDAVMGLLNVLRAAPPFTTDDGKRYALDVPSGLPNADEGFANEIMEIMIFAGPSPY